MDMRLEGMKIRWEENYDDGLQEVEGIIVREDVEYLLVELSPSGEYTFVPKAAQLRIYEADDEELEEEIEQVETSPKKKLSRPSAVELVEYLHTYRGLWKTSREVCEELGYDEERASRNLVNVAKKVPHLIEWGRGQFRIKGSTKAVIKFLEG